MRAKGDGTNEMSLQFPNRSRIIGLPGSEETIRGFSSVSLLLVDEAARVSDELYLTVRPMLAASSGALWLMSTPRGKRGFFHEAWEGGGPEWERIQREFLEEERETMGERWFQQEYMCEFVETESGIFDADLVRGAVSSEFGPLKI